MCLILAYLVFCFFFFLENVLIYNCTLQKLNFKKLYRKVSKVKN